MDDAEVARVRAYHTANNGVVACVGCNVMVFLQGNDKCECNKPLNYLQIVAENPAKLAKYIADMKSAELTPDYAEYIKHLNKNEGQSDADAHDLIDDLKSNMAKLHGPLTRHNMFLWCSFGATDPRYIIMRYY